MPRKQLSAYGIKGRSIWLNYHVKSIVLVPNRSIALHLPLLEWGCILRLFAIPSQTRLPLVRCPSGLWRKSYDHHWHLMNDHNDRGYHL